MYVVQNQQPACIAKNGHYAHVCRKKNNSYEHKSDKYKTKEKSNYKDKPVRVVNDNSDSYEFV